MYNKLFFVAAVIKVIQLLNVLVCLFPSLSLPPFCVSHSLSSLTLPPFRLSHSLFLTLFHNILLSLALNSLSSPSLLSHSQSPPSGAFISLFLPPSFPSLSPPLPLSHPFPIPSLRLSIPLPSASFLINLLSLLPLTSVTPSHLSLAAHPCISPSLPLHIFSFHLCSFVSTV